MGLPIMHALGKVNSLHQGPIFAPVELAQPHMLPSSRTFLRISGTGLSRFFKETHVGNSVQVQAWESKVDSAIRTC